MDVEGAPTEPMEVDPSPRDDDGRLHTQAEHTATLQWTSNIIRMYPYRPKEVRVREALEERQLQHAAADMADPSLRQGTSRILPLGRVV